VEATVVSIEQHNGSYVQKKKSTSELFYVAELLLNGADDVQIQVKAMGDTVGTLLGGMQASDFQQNEDSDDTAALQAAFDHVDTTSSRHFIIKVEYSDFAKTYEATALKMMD
jgi:hypothetical protein